MICDNVICYYNFFDEYGAIDKTTGKLLWNKSPEDNSVLTAQVYNNRFYVVLELKSHQPPDYRTGKGLHTGKYTL